MDSTQANRLLQAMAQYDVPLWINELGKPELATLREIVINLTDDKTMGQFDDEVQAAYLTRQYQAIENQMIERHGGYIRQVLGMVHHKLIEGQG